MTFLGIAILISTAMFCVTMIFIAAGLVSELEPLKGRARAETQNIRHVELYSYMVEYVNLVKHMVDNAELQHDPEVISNYVESLSREKSREIGMEISGEHMRAMVQTAINNEYLEVE